MKKPVRTAGAAVAVLGGATALALAPALAASAHVTASASSTAAGSYTVITFSVPHGCEGSPTIAVEIEIPETIPSVTPTVNPNWTIAKNTVPIDPAKQTGDLTERVGSVTYTALGAGLPDGYRDTMALSLQLPEGQPGDVVEFPVHQRCAEGSTDWVGDEVPSIVLTAAEAGGGHGGGHGGASGAETPASPATASDDVIARVLGIGGLVVGAVGIVLAATARRAKES